MKVSQI